MLYFRKHFSSVIKFKAAIRLRRGSAVSVFDPVPFKPAIKVCHPEIEIADAMRNLLQSKPFASIVLNGELFRSEEHTSELQSRPHLVCRLLLEKKKIE